MKIALYNRDPGNGIEALKQLVREKGATLACYGEDFFSWEDLPADTGLFLSLGGDGTFLQLVKRVTPKFGTFFAALTIFVIGPLYMVPRMSAAAWAFPNEPTGFNGIAWGSRWEGMANQFRPSRRPASDGNYYYEKISQMYKYRKKTYQSHFYAQA